MDEDFLLSQPPEEEQLKPAFSDLDYVDKCGGEVPEERVLDYFERSPFFDKSSNNKLLEQMNQLTPQALRSAKGKEYTVENKGIVKDKQGDEHRLYIIRKSLRADENTATTIALYYMIDNVIFQAPALQTVLTSRLVKAANFLQDAFSEVCQFIDFDPAKGYDWNYEHEKAGMFKEAKEAQEKLRKTRGQLSMDEFNAVMTTMDRKFPQLTRRRRESGNPPPGGASLATPATPTGTSATGTPHSAANQTKQGPPTPAQTSGGRVATTTTTTTTTTQSSPLPASRAPNSAMGPPAPKLG